MNTTAYAEMERNREHFTKHRRGNFRVFEIETSHITFQGKAWSALTNHLRRKFENMLFLDDAETKLPAKFIYH